MECSGEECGCGSGNEDGDDGRKGEAGEEECECGDGADDGADEGVVATRGVETVGGVIDFEGSWDAGEEVDGED